MTRTSIFLTIVCGVALTAACGGSETNNGGTDGGDASTSAASDASAVTDAQIEPSTDSMPPQPAADANPISISCMSARTCARNQSCCASITNSGVTVACANRCTANQFQICAASSECPNGEQCTASAYGASYCAAARAGTDAGTRPDAGVRRDAGVVEDAGPVDSGSADATPVSDAAPVDGSPSDDGSSDSAAGDGGDASEDASDGS